ncbi:MAG: hypothetical protein J6K32_02440 [Clostridia bacterium]|nr:hypothetical protein [Clostridia bacterium]
MNRDIDIVRATVMRGIGLMVEKDDAQASRVIRRAAGLALSGLQSAGDAQKTAFLDVLQDACMMLFWAGLTEGENGPAWMAFLNDEAERLEGQACSFQRSAQALLLCCAAYWEEDDERAKAHARRAYARMKALREEKAYRLSELHWCHVLTFMHDLTDPADIASRRALLRETLQVSGAVLARRAMPVERQLLCHLRLVALGGMRDICLREGRRAAAAWWVLMRGAERLRRVFFSLCSVVSNAVDDAAGALRRFLRINPAAALFAGMMMLALTAMRMMR